MSWSIVTARSSGTCDSQNTACSRTSSSGSLRAMRSRMSAVSRRMLLRDEEHRLPSQRDRARVAARENLLQNRHRAIRVHLKERVERGDPLIVVIVPGGTTTRRPPPVVSTKALRCCVHCRGRRGRRGGHGTRHRAGYCSGDGSRSRCNCFGNSRARCGRDFRRAGLVTLTRELTADARAERLRIARFRQRGITILDSVERAERAPQVLGSSDSILCERQVVE